MKKQYVTPKAEKLMFEYENVVAISMPWDEDNVKEGPGNAPQSSNACHTGNTSDVFGHNCHARNDKQPNGKC